MTEPATFQRIVLGIRHNVPREGLRQAMDFASLLGIELRGLFFKEGELGSLAAFPFVREFRLLEGGWRNIQPAEMADAINVAARSAERSFRAAVKTLNLPSEFEVVQSRSIAEALASVSRSGDILVVAEPENPCERVSLQFQTMLAVAIGSPASVMFVPAEIARSTGPVIAIVNAPDDPCLGVAARIAALAKERLSVVDGTKVAAGVGIATREQAAPFFRVADTLEPLRERLVVLTRSNFDNSLAGMISSVRRVPVLLVEPKSDQGGKQ
jgi:hypothetical protein